MEQERPRALCEVWHEPEVLATMFDDLGFEVIAVDIGEFGKALGLCDVPVRLVPQA